MRDYFSESYLRDIHRQIFKISGLLRLPLRSQVWQGRTGNWFGVGTGSSIDFQDHRAYEYGDDPRYIDWRAYARTGHYVMKLYREEVSPNVDLVLDVSPSMFINPAKARRTLELLYFVVESARHVGAKFQCVFTYGRQQSIVPLEAILAYRLDGVGGGEDAGSVPNLEGVNWRHGSLRVVVSDLLYPGSPEHWMSVFCSKKGRGVILVPFSREEAAPQWSGATTFVDCESRDTRKENVEADLLSRYRDSYTRHFDMWRNSAFRYGLTMARVPAEESFRRALFAEAFSVGAVESCR